MTRTVLMLVALALVPSVVVAADQKAVNKSDRKIIYELQERCAETCNNYILGDEDVTGHECHYNIRLNKCFIVVYSHTPTGGTDWRSLVDILGNKIYDQVGSGDYRTCDIYDYPVKDPPEYKELARCKEKITKDFEKEIRKFNKRIKPYMTE